MITIYDEGTGAVVGAVTDAQLKFLIDHLEEDSIADADYYINAMTIDGFEQDGADPGLVQLLRKALGDREDMDIRWERE